MHVHHCVHASTKVMLCLQRYGDANRNFSEKKVDEKKIIKLFMEEVTINVSQKSHKVSLNITVFVRSYAKEKPTP